MNGMAPAASKPNAHLWDIAITMESGPELDDG